MKQMKRLLAALLTAVMVLGAVPFAAIAASQYEVGLYWGKYAGVDASGEPAYVSISDDGLMQNTMWDEVGQTVTAVFLFWDGTAFSVIPPDDLEFPAKLEWEPYSKCKKAVYMEFDTAMDDEILYETGGKTYELTLEVVNLLLDSPLSYHDECVRSNDTQLTMGKEGEILYGTPGKPDTAWLMWDPAQVGTVTGVTVYFEDVDGDGEVLKNNETLADAAATLKMYDITLTPALNEGYIRVDADFDGARNLILTLTNTAGETFSRHLNIDEKSSGTSATLPDVAFFTQRERTRDYWIKNELVQGAAGTTCTVYFMWDPDTFEVTDEADIQVYFERNEEKGIELPATVWDADVDEFLEEEGYRLTLNTKYDCVEVTATFDRTVDFSLILTDENGEEAEAQINFDEGASAAVTDDRTLRWKRVEETDDGVFVIPETETFKNRVVVACNGGAYMAVFAVEQDSEELIPTDDLDTDGPFTLRELGDDSEVYFRLAPSGVGNGLIGMGNYDAGLMPKYTDLHRVDDAAVDAVELVCALELMLGYTDGTFRPNESVSNAQLAKLACAVLDTEPGDKWDYDSVFVDVPAGDWYTRYVNYCYEQGLIDRRENGTFGPAENALVVDAAKILLCAMGYSADDEGYLNTYDGWEERVLEDARAAGLLAGIPLEGDEEITRQYLCLMVENALMYCDAVDEDGETFRMGEETFDLTEDSVIRHTVYNTISVHCVLPTVALFSENRRSADTLIDEDLNFTDADGVKMWLLPEEGWSIASVTADFVVDEPFLSWEMADDNAYAVFTVEEGFRAQRKYTLIVNLESADGTETLTKKLVFSVFNALPGLYWNNLKQGKNDDYTYNTEFSSLKTSMEMEVGDSAEAVFLFWDGENFAEIPAGELTFPAGITAEDHDEYDGGVSLAFNKQVDGQIRCLRNGTEYAVPVTVELPLLGFYREPAGGEDAYAGTSVTFDGKDDQGEAAEKEVRYLRFRDGRTIVSATADQPFVTLEISDDGTYVTVTVEEGFDSGDRCTVTLCAIDPEEEEEIDERFRFTVEDVRARLMFCWGDEVADVEDGEPDLLKDTAQVPMDTDVTMGFYLLRGGRALTQGEKADLDFGAARAEWDVDLEAYTVRFDRLGPQTIVCTDSSGSYALTVTVTLPEVDLSTLGSAQAVNGVLGSDDGLLNWLEDNLPGTHAAVLEAMETGEELDLVITLAPEAYDGILTWGAELSEDFEGTVLLRGSEDRTGNRTVLPGLRTVGGDTIFVEGIDFLFDPDIPLTPEGETATCGVLLAGEGADGDIYSLRDCTFTGFERGVCSTPTGYAAVQNCRFIHCGTGYYADCAGKESGNGNRSVRGCLFLCCDVAIRIKSLPDYIAPGTFRVEDNDFIHNGVDVDVSQAGNLYFYRNYFGSITDGSSVEAWDDATARPALVRGRGCAQVTANPRWRYPVTLDAPCNYLYLDTGRGLVNRIEGAEAAELAVSAADLNSGLNSAETPVDITLVTEAGTELGTWTFANGPAQNGQQTVDGDFCADLQLGTDAEGNLTVTLQPGDILAARVPTLSLPVDFGFAKVLYNGAAVAGVTVFDGKVRFPVAAGGTYTVVNTEEEADIYYTEDEDAGAWYFYGDGCAQIELETRRITEQVDPGREDLGTAPDTVTETEYITVEALYKAPEYIAVTVLTALYDQDGRLLAARQHEITEGTNSLTVSCERALTDTETVQLRAFILLNDGSLIPMVAPLAETLPVPQN
ncbi:MAG: S-layer homology domain-containing protein [Clostridia bacterium]|nr:S-layer homology domain-containing protein [Clostridia bacterium]